MNTFQHHLLIVISLMTLALWIPLPGPKTVEGTLAPQPTSVVGGIPGPKTVEGTLAPQPTSVVEGIPGPKTVEPTVPAFHQHCEFEPPPEFDGMIMRAAKTYGIDPRVLAVTVYRESDCNPAALGGAGEISLTQVNPSVWVETLQEAGVIQRAADLWDPQTNLNASAFILARLQRRAKTTWGIFYRYNGSGPQARRYADAQMTMLSVF